MDHEAQYGSIEEVDRADDSAQMASFKRTSVLLLLLCGTVAGAGLFVMGQQAAVGSAASLNLASQDAEPEAEASTDDVVVEEPVEEQPPASHEGVEPTTCDPGQEGPADESSPCAPCRKGFHKLGPELDGDNTAWCIPCPAGTSNDVEGWAEPCVMCGTDVNGDGGFAAKEGATECKPWGGCSPGDGVVKMGTPSTDTVCGSCPEGQTAPSDSAREQCFDMTDVDGDGLFDRIHPGWEPGMEFDKNDIPMGGGAFDSCPFDPENDKDGDGICGGVPPFAVWVDHLNEYAGEFYAVGGPRVDQCPDDPDNNKDKDRKCDQRGSDDQVISWDFYSHPLTEDGKKMGLVGWNDKQDAFGIDGEAPDGIPGLDDRRFIFDERVVEVCLREANSIEALFSVTRGRYDWTLTMKSVQDLLGKRDEAVQAMEDETDPIWKETAMIAVMALDDAIVAEKKKVTDVAYILKTDMHEIEDEIVSINRRMTNTARLLAGTDAEGDSSAADALSDKVKGFRKEIKAKNKLIDNIKINPDLPSAIADMKLANFKFPTCAKLCGDHNMKCLEGKLVASHNDLSESANELAETEINAAQQEIHKLVKKREDYEMYYEQARVKSEMIMDPKARAEHVTTKRTKELKGDLLSIQKEMEAALKKKKALEGKLSSCEPVDSQADEKRTARRAELLNERIAGFQETLDFLSTQQVIAESAVGAAQDDSEKRDAYTLLALINNEVEKTTEEKQAMEDAKTGCLDEEKDASIFLQCKCETDLEPVSTEEWSMSSVCTTCYAVSKRSTTGITGAVFTIKKNTFRFAMQGVKSLANFAKLTVLDKDFAGVAGKMPGARNLDGRDSFQESVTNEPHADADGNDEEPAWYPTEWDVSEFVGRQALIQIAHMDKETPMKFDEFEFFDDAPGCLPTCMAIRDGVCNDGETCFWFEKDHTPYVETKSTGFGMGIYCRASNGAGSPLGPGISNMGYDFNDWTDTHPDVKAAIQVYDDLVMEHDKKKSEFLRKEKAKGKNDHEETVDGVIEDDSELGATAEADHLGEEHEMAGWMMDSDKIMAELGKIDEKYEDLLFEQKKEIQRIRDALMQRIAELEQAQNLEKKKLKVAIMTEAEQWGHKERLIDVCEADITNLACAEMEDAAWKDKYNVVIVAQKAAQESIKAEIANQQTAITDLRGADAGWAESTLDYLSVRHLPRCIKLEMRGSHYAISVPGQSGATMWAYAPEPSLDNAKTNTNVDGTHCVFNSLKPRCLSVSKGSSQFTKDMHANCKEEIFEGTCYNQCARFFCSDAYDKGDTGAGDLKDACGKDDADSPGAYDRCANCCGRLSENDGWSSCLTRRRRRRLREAVATFDNEDSEDHKYSRHECAESCLQTDGCIAFDTRNGACIISSHCDHAAGEGSGFRDGKWYIKQIADDTLSKEERVKAYADQLGRDEDYGKPQKRRVRKDKAAMYENTMKEDQDEIAEQMQDVRDNVELTAEQQQQQLEALEAERTDQLGADADGSRLAGNGGNGAEVVV